MAEKSVYTPQPKEKVRKQPETLVGGTREEFLLMRGLDINAADIPADAAAEAQQYIALLIKKNEPVDRLSALLLAYREKIIRQSRELGTKSWQIVFASNSDLAFDAACYAALINQPGVASLAGKLYTKRRSELEQVNGSYAEYRAFSGQLGQSEEKLNALLVKMFKERGQEPEPTELARRDLLEDSISVLETKLKTTKQKNPQAAAEIEFEKIAAYAKQLQENGFVWTDSRRRIQRAIFEKALSDKPIAVLMGESGSGKTALARSTAQEITGREPERTVGGPEEQFRRLLAFQAIAPNGQTYWEFAPLLRAITGRDSEIQSAPANDGGVFFDDEFNTRPPEVQRLILKFVSEVRPGREMTAPGTSLKVKAQPKFMYLAAGNTPSARYKREEAGVETKREFAGQVINVPFLEQSADNPELFQLLCAGLLNRRTKQMAAAPGEIQPNFIPDAQTGASYLDTRPERGGFLWRFANAWKQLLDAFEHKETALHRANPAEPKNKFYLKEFILDAGTVLRWLAMYKKSSATRRNGLDQFMRGQLGEYVAQFAGDVPAVKAHLKHFGIDLDAAIATVSPPAYQVLTPQEIGFLSPSVPRPRQERAKDLPPASRRQVLDFNGEEIVYEIKGVSNFAPGTKLKLKFGHSGPVEGGVLVGKTPDGQAVVESGSMGNIIPAPELLEKYETVVETTVVEARQALNPYSEALLESGLPSIARNLAAAERKDIAVDLREALRNDQANYQQMGLSAWAENIATADFSKLTPEKRQTIEQEIAAGAIPVFMPDKATQLNTSVEQFKTAFKPVWIKEGKTQTVQNGYLEWEHFVKLINDKAPELVAGVPNRPYISMMKPTQKPDARTMNKTVVDQLTEFAAINTERVAARQAPANVTNPHEYGALQTMHSRSANALMPSLPTTLNPIDSQTWSRFINLPVSAGRGVPSADFGLDDARARFVRGGADQPNPRDGFRLSVRVEL